MFLDLKVITNGEISTWVINRRGWLKNCRTWSSRAKSRNL